MRGSYEIGETLLERFCLGPHRNPTAVQHVEDLAIFFRTEVGNKHRNGDGRAHLAAISRPWSWYHAAVRLMPSARGNACRPTGHASGLGHVGTPPSWRPGGCGPRSDRERLAHDLHHEAGNLTDRHLGPGRTDVESLADAPRLFGSACRHLYSVFD